MSKRAKALEAAESLGDWTEAKRRATTEARKLFQRPTDATKAERALLGMLDAVRLQRKSLEVLEAQLEKANRPLAPLRLRAPMARELHTKKIELSKFAKWLERSRENLRPDSIADRREDAAVAECRRAVERRQELLDSLGPRTNPRSRGTPAVPEHFYVLGSFAVGALRVMGAGRSPAARAVAACLAPLLPRRRDSQGALLPGKMTLAGKTLLQWKSDRAPRGET